MKRVLPALLAVFVILSGSLLAGEYESVRKAPELRFKLPGQGDKQLSEYLGKVVALEFIFTTCPHCQAASHIMTKLQAEYGNRGLQVLDIAVNPNADLLVENFVKDYQVGFPVGWTASDTMTTFMGFEAGRYVVPQLALIDRRGFLHYQTPAKEDAKWDKLMKEETIRQNIEQLLAAPKADRLSTRLNTRP